ncbi:MAG: arylsulfotransferase family protein [Acidimicrobiales bacterium]
MTDTELSRRALLARLARGGAGAGAAALLGGSLSSCGQADAPGAGGRDLSAASLPQLASATSALRAGDAYAFRSRPDLKAPVITLDVRTAEASPGLIVTDAHAGPTYQGPLILDGEGNLVWFLPLSPGKDVSKRAFNVRVQSYRGRPVLAWFVGAVVLAHGQGHYELWDSSYSKVAEVHGQDGYQADLHEFLLTKQGTALFTCYGQANANLSKFGGKTVGSYFYGVVQEVDLGTGKLLFEWRSDSHVALEESYLPLKNPDYPWDYFHVNSIDIDPTDGHLIVSGRNTSTFYKLHRTSGEVLWKCGGKSSDFEIAQDSNYFFQHDVRRRPDGSVTLFDNEGGPPWRGSQSRALVLAFDEKARTVELIRQYVHSPKVRSGALGSVQDLADGHRFVGWGEASYFTEYDGAGRVVFDGGLAPGTESYRAFKQRWVGRPKVPPAIFVARGGSSATVYASHNGCTGIAKWVIVGGATAARLAPVGWAKHMGFETAVTVPRPPAYLAAEAVDGAGQVLGRSAPASLR